MSRSVKPLKVSPFIKAMRWSLLGCGIFYGNEKLEKYTIYEASVRPQRLEKIKEKYKRLRIESGIRDTKEIYEVGKEFEITEFPPGWNSEL